MTQQKYDREDTLDFQREFLPSRNDQNQDNPHMFTIVTGKNLGALAWLISTEQFDKCIIGIVDAAHDLGSVGSSCYNKSLYILLEEHLEELPLRIECTCVNCPDRESENSNPTLYMSSRPLCASIAKWRLKRGK